MKYEIEDKSLRVKRDLARIESGFLKFRNRSGAKKNYPARLRILAVNTVASGVGTSEVAEAANVTIKSIANWQRALSAAKIEPARELVLAQVSETERQRVEGNEIVGLANIHLQSGIRIELPVSILTASFLKSLGHGVE